MIRLRESIERWLRHRWLGPVRLFGMLAFHEGVEKLLESPAGFAWPSRSSSVGQRL